MLNFAVDVGKRETFLSVLFIHANCSTVPRDQLWVLEKQWCVSVLKYHGLALLQFLTLCNSYNCKPEVSGQPVMFDAVSG